MFGEDAERHLLNPLFVEAELTFILDQKGVGQLTEGGGTACIDQGTDKQGLVDVAHPHSLGDE
jgi:hypothetical protein